MITVGAKWPVRSVLEIFCFLRVIFSYGSNGDQGRDLANVKTVIFPKLILPSIQSWFFKYFQKYFPPKLVS